MIRGSRVKDLRSKSIRLYQLSLGIRGTIVKLKAEENVATNLALYMKIYKH